MTEHDLFTAIGQSKDAFLPELTPIPVYHRPQHLGFIAAILALILTACAVPTVIHSFDKLKSGQIVPTESDKVWEYWLVFNSNGEKIRQKSTTIYESGDLDIQVEPDTDAPQTIEEYRFPLRLSELYDVVEYSCGETLFSVEFQGTAPQNQVLIDIEYRQYALPEDGRITVEDFFLPGPMEESAKQYGEITVLQYDGYGESVDPIFFTAPENYVVRHTVRARYLFWSEGMYLYCLKLPKVYPLVNDADFEKIITSLSTVEDITGYLPAAN